MTNSEGIVNINAVDRVVIVGGGTAGWMAAAALSRYFDNGRRKIVLVESDAIGTVGVGEATIPPIASFNAMLDINENDFLRATRGTFKLGIEFVNWGRLGDRYFHPFGTYGQDLHGIKFHQLFLREAARGGPRSIADFSMSTAAAAAGRFGRPAPGAQSLVSQIAYAFHFDAGLYASFLRKMAEKQGTRRREGRIVRVHRNAENGDVTGVELDGGEVVKGDLFLDCSGFRGLLIEEALETGYEEWSRWLPMDRALAMPTANTRSPPPFTRATAHGAGWQWRIPLQHRTGNGHVFCSAYTNADDAETTLRDHAEGEPLADPRLLRFVTGMRRKAWNHNVVSLGLSAGFIEPLESTSIHLIQNGIARLFALFPEREISPLERDEYNRGMRELYEDVRDFIILHYKATQRNDTPFWRYVREMDVPESLTRKMALWRLHGRIFRENAELFSEPSWIAVMLGQNVWPDRYDPIADTLDEHRVASAMAQMREAYHRTAQGLPTQEEFLRQAGAWHEEGPTGAPPSPAPFASFHATGGFR
ncbi:tryptophan halogenase family protein [Aurantiacibacter spongiae]|uniref:Tryptophan 7-halogenase n=1 Tax=Aurantiacibacter spongiae TaxID=2488860 RepID=A0A3N5DJN4_9SPHN|nr:tryptophan halogenase family protein [Aurantiacibacter spongiae]RPF70935.1 tryptophan 7-halogenase [Aurantiacibacter spongiae]